MFIVLIDLLNIDCGHGNIASLTFDIYKHERKFQNCSFKKRGNSLSLLFNDEKNSKSE